MAVWTRNGFHIQYKVRPAQLGLLSSKARNVSRSVNTSAVVNAELNRKNFRIANIVKL